MKIIAKIVFAICYIVLMTSCEQPDGPSEFINTNDQEKESSYIIEDEVHNEEEDEKDEL